MDIHKATRGLRFSHALTLHSRDSFLLKLTWSCLVTWSCPGIRRIATTGRTSCSVTEQGRPITWESLSTWNGSWVSASQGVFQMTGSWPGGRPRPKQQEEIQGAGVLRHPRPETDHPRKQWPSNAPLSRALTSSLWWTKISSFNLPSSWNTRKHLLFNHIRTLLPQPGAFPCSPRRIHKDHGVSHLCVRTSKCFLGAKHCGSVSVSCSVVSDSLQPHELQPSRLLCPWDSQGKNTGVGCHFLLQGIFLTQGSNPGLLHCRQILYHLSLQGTRQKDLQIHWWLLRIQPPFCWFLGHFGFPSQSLQGFTGVTFRKSSWCQKVSSPFIPAPGSPHRPPGFQTPPEKSVSGTFPMKQNPWHHKGTVVQLPSFQLKCKQCSLF